MLRFTRSLIITAAIVAGFGAITVMRPASASAASCVDGSNRANLVAVWLTRDTTHIKTKSGGKLCKDVQIFVSSYVMPDNYNGKPFKGNKTAIPQTRFASKAVTLKAGTNGDTTITIPVPNLCTNAQMDIYLAPEIINVDASGHKHRNIKGQLSPRTKTVCTVTPPVTPPVVPPVTPPVVPPVTPPVTPETPTVLPSTGPTSAVAVIVVAATVVGTALAYLRNRRVVSQL